ncbi:MAG: SAM-dependent methyltransferase, partial [Candidatus Ventricola sp.]
AGTPCISDPGSVLVREAAALGIEVLAVPGPTAMASALSVSGMDTREFAFYGFLPRQKKELREKLLSMKRSGTPIGVVHESPHRVIELVRTIAETLPGCCICASCDLTKLYEKTIRGTAEEVLSQLMANSKAEKGEYCLVLDMSGVELEEHEARSDASLEAQLFEEMMNGFDLRQASMALTERGYRRNDVYRARTNVQRFLDDLMSEYDLSEEEDSDERDQ